MKTIQATVGEGGVLHIEHVPFDPGTRLDVTIAASEPEMTHGDWVTHLRRHYGALADTDFEVPVDYPPSEIEPLR